MKFNRVRMQQMEREESAAAAENNILIWFTTQWPRQVSQIQHTSHDKQVVAGSG